MDSAYAPPKSDSESPTAASTALYTPGQIAAAAFFGTLAASAWLARANLVTIGQRERGNRVLLTGIVITAAIFGVSFVLPDNIPGVVYTVPQILLARRLAQDEFGAHLELHDRASNWGVFRTCLASIAIIVLAIAAIAFTIADV